MDTLRIVVTWIFGTLILGLVLLVLNENMKEVLKRWGGNTLLVRWWDALPEPWKDSFRWQSLRGLWWLWSIFGLSGGVALALWLTPLIVGPSRISIASATGVGGGQIAVLQSQVATLVQQLSATAQERDDLRRKLQTSPQSQTKVGIDLNEYSRKTCFDYSTNNGVVKVGLNEITFEIRFTKRSTDSIYVYKDGTNLRAIADLREVNPGEDINFAAFDSSSRVYAVPLGGYFIAQNMDGYFILARILSIKDERLIPLSQVNQNLVLAGQIRNGAGFGFFGRS